MTWFRRGLGVIVGAVVMVGAVTLPARRAEASDSAMAAVIGGMAGLIIGSEMQHAHQHRQRCYQRSCQMQKMNQRLLVREVLQKYHPDYHDQFVEYVMFDLEGYITPAQQRQLLNMLEQRHNAYYTCR